MRDGEREREGGRERGREGERERERETGREERERDKGRRERDRLMLMVWSFSMHQPIKVCFRVAKGGDLGQQCRLQSFHLSL